MNKKIIGLVSISIMMTIIACGFSSLPSAVPTLTSSPTRPSTLDAVTPTVLIPGSDQSFLETSGDLSRLYDLANPGVVTIWSFEDLGDVHTGSIPTGQGSGFVIDQDGYIVTNQHVVEGADEIEIDFVSGVKAWAELIGTDPDSDLAVLKVTLPAEQLFPLPLGDSDQVRVGNDDGGNHLCHRALSLLRKSCAWYQPGLFCRRSDPD
jgi:S1-C subfamily serine protease